MVVYDFELECAHLQDTSDRLERDYPRLPVRKLPYREVIAIRWRRSVSFGICATTAADSSDSSILPEDMTNQSVRIKEEQLRKEEEKLREIEFKVQREIQLKRQELLAKEDSLKVLEARLGWFPSCRVIALATDVSCSTHWPDFDQLVAWVAEFIQNSVLSFFMTPSTLTPWDMVDFTLLENLEHLVNVIDTAYTSRECLLHLGIIMMRGCVNVIVMLAKDDIRDDHVIGGMEYITHAYFAFLCIIHHLYPVTDT